MNKELINILKDCYNGLEADKGGAKNPTQHINKQLILLQHIRELESGK